LITGLQKHDLAWHIIKKVICSLHVLTSVSRVLL
jgi:amino acid transporter